MSSSSTDQKQGDLLEATPAGPAVEPFRAKNEYFTPSNLISLMRAMMAAGVRDASCESMSAATPETRGAEKLVP